MSNSTGAIKVGDYVDVRAVAMSVDGDVVTVRIPGATALHQIVVGRAAIMHTIARSSDAIAADVVCASYTARAPLPVRRKK